MAMKAKEKPVQLTVRGLPREVDRRLRERAAHGGKSLNQEIVDTLTGATLGQRRYADFSNLGPAWQEDAGFDEMLAAQQQPDEATRQ
ncbi:MAG: FitA-like ribbon-helix-helix domain-containing protein [Terriglobales bacterium]